MRVDFHLPDLPVPRLTEALLRESSTILQEIARRNRDRFEQGTETPPFKNRKEELIQRLRRRVITGESFEEVSDVVGRERLLLSIYLGYLGRADARDWLPPFDNVLARSLLGNLGADWHAGRRQQVTLLFFMHFDQLPSLNFLCARLIEAYVTVRPHDRGPTQIWHEKRETLFNPASPENIAKQLRNAETLSTVMERYAIPNNGRLAEKLRQIFLLNAIKVAPFGIETPAFTEVEELRKQRASESMLMGAAALKIMVQRVATEGGRSWSDEWPRWITRFGCDPRYGRASAEGAKWWGWATDSELRLAQQGITGLTLEFFIGFLEDSLRGTEREGQFALRSRFLLALHKAKKIQQARLVLNWSSLQRLDRKHRNPYSVAHLSATMDQTSIVCLSCTDDIYVIEGTHNFGLRMFHRSFPVDGFWERPAKTYQDRDLRISPANCPVFLVHSQSGNWVKKFFDELRTKFHVEWDDVDLRRP
jgi:hypothetical protein